MRDIRVIIDTPAGSLVSAPVDFVSANLLFLGATARRQVTWMTPDSRPLRELTAQAAAAGAPGGQMVFGCSCGKCLADSTSFVLVARLPPPWDGPRLAAAAPPAKQSRPPHPLAPLAVRAVRWAVAALKLVWSLR